jgi:sulfonate transport system permease protein
VGLLAPTLIILLWEITCRLNWVRSVVLPAPTIITKAAVDLISNPAFLFHVWTSLSLIMRGFIYGTVLGFLTGSAAGLSITTERLCGPFLNSIRQVPTIAWLPLIAFSVGHDDPGKVTIVGMTAYFPVFINTLQGITHVSPEYLEVAQAYGFTRWQLIRRVLMPEAAPLIFVGIRYGAGLSWTTILVAEMLSGRKGLGYLLDRRMELLVTDEAFAIIILIGFLGFLLDALLRTMEARFMKWEQSPVASVNHTRNTTLTGGFP